MDSDCRNDDHVSICVFGGLSVRSGELLLIDESWPRVKARALLKLLALGQGQPLHREQTFEALWPGMAPAAADNNLRKTLHYLRTAFESAGTPLPVATSGVTLTLDPAVTVDLHEFQRLASCALSVRTDAGAFDAALAVHRGELLPADLYEPWTEPARRDSQTLYQRLLLELARLLLLQGDRAESARRLNALLTCEPGHEDGHFMLMSIYAAEGGRAEALAQFDRCRLALRDAAGVEPGPALRRLRDDIAAGRNAPPIEIGPLGPFVGRGLELDELRSGFDRVLAGRGYAAMVTAGPGLGKTRICEEFALYAHLRGARVLWGGCYEGDGAPPFWPWRQALKTHLGHDGVPGTTDAGDAVEAIAQAEPRAALPFSAGAGHADRFRVFASTAALLRGLARRQPVVVVLDDLHTADEGSLLMLEFVTRELQDAPVMFLATSRDVGLGRPLTGTLVELMRQTRFSRIDLHELEREDVARYIESVKGTAQPAAIVAMIHDATGGQPLFMRELVHAYIEQGTNGATVRVAAPSSVRDVIRLRMERLADGSSALLSVAAVMGREFAPDAVARAAGVTPGDLRGVLDAAIAERVVSPPEAGARRHRFIHALFAETLYDDLPLDRRIELHRLVAEALEATRDDDPTLVSELAHHFARAAESGSDSLACKAVHYNRMAADRAFAMTAYEEACASLRTALRFIGARAETDEVARCDVLLALTRAQFAAGDMSGARESAMACADLARALGLGDRLAWIAIHYSGPWSSMQMDPLVKGLLEDALKLMGEEETPLRAWVLARLGAELLGSPPPERSEELIREGVRVARKTKDPGATAAVLEKYLNIIGGADRLEEQLAIAEEIRSCAELAHIPEIQLVARGWRFDKLLQVGRTSEAWAEQEQHAREAEELRQPSFLYVAAQYRVMRAFLDGRLSELDALIDDEAALARAARASDGAAIVSVHRIMQYYEQGRLPEIEPVVARGVASAPGAVGFRASLIFINAGLGRADRVREDLRYLAADSFQAVRATLNRLNGGFTLFLLGEAAARFGERDQMQWLYEALLPYAHYYITVENGIYCTGSAERVLGKLAAALGDRRRAEAHFEAALQANERIDAVTWLARTRADYAVVLRSATDSKSQRSAASLLAEARATASALRLESLLQSIEDL